jgi:hypothetical protein
MTSSLDSQYVAQYLADNPDFFQEHGALLAKIRLPSPLTGRAVSLQERQIEVLREKYKVLELRMAELMRLAQDNDVITHKLQSWTRTLLTARNDVDLPHTLNSGLKSIFGVPHATLRIWQVAPQYAHTWYSQGPLEDTKLFADSLQGPYCGKNKDFEAVRWLENAEVVQSAAILPLRIDSSSETFGLLVLGSPDAERFHTGMATDFLAEIGKTASAALMCLLD